MKLYSLLILFQIIFVTTCDGKTKSNSVAIPRSKSKNENILSKVLGQGMVHKLIREIKISFCSELEALTLQVLNILLFFIWI